MKLGITSRSLFRQAILPALLAASQLAPAQSAGQHTVALQPGVCAAVTEGDIVTFEWAPALDHSNASLSNLHLVFGRLDHGQVQRVGDRVTLSAIPTRGQGTPVGQGIAPAVNGISQMSFRIYLRGAPSGQYDLIQARHETSPDATAAGNTPAMTNSPTRLHYCLNVTAPAITTVR